MLKIYGYMMLDLHEQVQTINLDISWDKDSMLSQKFRQDYLTISKFN